MLWHQPLSFPADADRRVDRRLVPYRADSNQVLSDGQFLEELAQKQEWYAILSAEGTGKTSFLNWIASELGAQARHWLVVGPIDMAKWHNHDQVVPLLQHILEVAQAAAGQELGPDSAETRLHLSDFAQRLTTSIGSPRRVLLLLDNFQKLPLSLATDFTRQLKDLHNSSISRITCVIAGDDDLDTIHQTVSPLSGIVKSYSLADFEPRDVFQLLEYAAQADVTLSRRAEEQLMEITEGQPLYVWALLEVCHQQRPSGKPIDLNRARQETLRTDGRLGQLLGQTAETLRLPANTLAVSALLRLIRKEDFDLSGAYTDRLELKGVVRHHADKVVWRNPIVRDYFISLEPYFKQSRVELRATGTIHVSLILNFRHFVMREHKAEFDHSRGNQEYETALDQLVQCITAFNQDSAARFIIPEDEKQLRRIMADLNIFRYEAAKATFSPIYQLRAENSSMISEAEVSSTLGNRVTTAEYAHFVSGLQEEWRKWDRKSLQLTRDGLIHVRLEQDFRERGLLYVSRRVMGLERDPAQVSDNSLRTFREQLDRSIQWEIAFALVEMFIKTCLKQMDGSEEYYALPGLLQLRLVPGGEGDAGAEREAPVYPLHDRYVLYEFTKLCDCREFDENGKLKHNLMTSVALQDRSDYGRGIHALLEGILVDENSGPGQWQFPDVTEKDIQTMLDDDLSSWDHELCLLSRDNGVVYYHLWQPDACLPQDNQDNCQQCELCHSMMGDRFHQLHFMYRPNIRYKDYWRCIIRGLQYILELRLLARLLATNSTTSLEQIAEHEIRPVADQLHDPRFIANIAELRRRVATNTRLLAHLRDVTTPLFIARADYAARKFDYFINISGFEKTLLNASEDIRAINTFLQHFDALLVQREAEERRRLEQEHKEQEQRNSEHLARRIGVLSIILAVIALPIILPSFWIDFEQSQFGKWLDNTSANLWFKMHLSGSFGLGLVDLIQIVVTLLVIYGILRIWRDWRQTGKS